jgi:PAS domain S-box-containing protein
MSQVVAHPTLKVPTADERFLLAERAAGIGTFVWDLAGGTWDWSPQVAHLFGLKPEEAAASFAEWEQLIFPDDVPKLNAALDEARRTGAYYAEFRVRAAVGLRWLAGKGVVDRDESGQPRWLCGVYYDISERKELEARLLAVNETLVARVRELREEARTLELLNNTGAALAGELSLERLVQIVTDAAVSLSGAQFGTFFYNTVNAEGEAYALCALSGVPSSAFEKFPLPRSTAVFEPTFRGSGPVRSDDVLADPRYGKNAPYLGLPPGPLPVRSYMAIPVISRSAEVIGGLFFGHPEPGVFTEREMTGMAI